jgi:signal transduction histidine kinase
MMPDQVTNRSIWELDSKLRRFTRTGDLNALMGLDARDPVTIEMISSMVVTEDRSVLCDLFDAPLERGFFKTGVLRVTWKDGSTHALRFLVGPDVGVEGAHQIGIVESADGEHGTMMSTDDLVYQLEGVKRQRDMILDETQRTMYHLAHDLQAPIRHVMGFSQAIKERHSQGLDAKGMDYLNRVVQESGHMNLMIAGLLQLSRLSTLPMNIRTLDLSAIAQGKAESLRKKYQRSIRFLIQGGVHVNGDEHLMDILIGELMDNSCKFTSTRDDPTISFGLREGEGGPSVFIQDNGVGFDPVYSDRLFTPFQRLHSENEFPGIGMGLAIASLIVRRHGGIIRCESMVDSGATFLFTIPPIV